MKKIFYILILLLNFLCSAQGEKLQKLQKNYPNFQTRTLQKSYKKYRQIIENSKEPPSPPNFKFDRLVKFYDIPFKERLKIFPFDIYDSIYISIPILIKDNKEPRNYLEEKYHGSIRLTTKNEIKKLTNILFNYSKMYGYVKEYRGYKNIGCDCIENEYPKIILLFKKNGKFEKYIAFPDEMFLRTNFIYDDFQKYYTEFYFCAEKEDFIVNIFIPKKMNNFYVYIKVKIEES